MVRARASYIRLTKCAGDAGLGECVQHVRVLAHVHLLAGSTHCHRPLSVHLQVGVEGHIPGTIGEWIGFIRCMSPMGRPGWYNVLARTDFVPYLEPEKTPPHSVRPPSFTLPSWRTEPEGLGHCQICERRVVLPELVTLCCKILTLPYHRKDPSTLPRCCCI